MLTKQLSFYNITRLGLFVTSLALLMVWLVPPTHAADGVVGTGSAGSCTEGEFRSEVAAGGIITFACGSNPHTITLSGGAGEVPISQAVSLDGGDLVTISGGGNTRIFNVSNSLSLQNITLTTGSANEGAAIRNTGTVWVVNSTIQNSLCTGTSGNHVGCGIYNFGGAVRIISSTLTGNDTATGYGGGIANVGGLVEIVRSTLESNQAERGGAISNGFNGTVRIRNSMLQSNSSTGNNDLGGAIFALSAPVYIIDSTLDNNTAGEKAGGVYFNGEDSANLYIWGSTFSNNQANQDNSDTASAGGLDVTAATAVISNSTFYNNTGWNPGAIFIDPSNTTNVSIVNSTIANNNATKTGGKVGGVQIQTGDASLTLRNTILANADGNCNSNNPADITNGGGNIQQFDTNCVGGSTVNPLLGGLTDNGGSTETQALSSSSPAIDGGTNSGCPATDQRGFGRPAGSTCDSGAYEADAPTPPVPTLTDIVTETATAGQPVVELTVSGTDFTAGSIVVWNGEELPTLFVSETELTAFIAEEQLTGQTPVTVCAESSDPNELCTAGTESEARNFVVGNELTDLDLAGPSMGAINSFYAFTATVSPPTATTPITYNWQASGNVTPQALTADNSYSFQWAEAGPQVVTVTAYNPLGSIFATQAITLYVPPSTVEIFGPDAGKIYSRYQFTTTLTPPTTTMPVSYTWSATEQTVLPPSTMSDTVSFTWVNSGTKTVTVTAHNEWGMVTDTHTVEVEAPPLVVELSGPLTGVVDQQYEFIGSIVSPDPLLPVTYTWEATDLPAGVSGSSLKLTDTFTLTWDTPGTKQITLTVENPSGVDQARHTVEISIPPSGVTLAGPTVSSINSSTPFTAMVSPADVSQPVTYIWQATEQTTISPTNGLTNPVAFTWTTTGTKHVTVTAVNATGLPVQAMHTVEVTVPPNPDGVTIGGPDGSDAPSMGNINESYTFTVNVSPITATQPVTYTWQATDQEPVTESGDVSSEQPFTWQTPGEKTITVTVQNPGGTVTTVYTITINVPSAMVELSGPQVGRPGMEYEFMATVSPPTTTTPITYMWQATGLADVTQQDGISNTLALNWPTPGMKLITVTASNASGMVSATQSITLDLPPEGVSLSGPDSPGEVGASYRFTATVAPLTTTTPITYVWQATDQTVLTQSGALDDAVDFTWVTPGEKEINVMALNHGGTVSDSMTFTVAIAKVITPLTSVEISGPLTVTVGVTNSFMVQINPVTASMPINYQWTPEPLAGQGSMVVSYTWPLTGTRVITVAAANAVSFATDTHTITVTAEDEDSGPPTVYLPILQK